jgi:hypothetical protein
MVKLCNKEQEKYSKDDLVTCFKNAQTIVDVIDNPKVKFTGSNGPILAALKI